MKYLIFCLMAFVINATNCNKEGVTDTQATPGIDAKVLDKIWHQGKAEISTYDLKQNRYRDIHDGELVMIFVSEDFLKDKHVKNDHYKSEFSTPILKNNRIRKFTTGLYDYSIYTSVFTDVNKASEVNTLKVTMSSQDWCGQSFVQLNNKGQKNQIKSFSYFESEGDEEFRIEDALLVDEIYNLIRLGDKFLPQGTFKVVPTLMYSRLKHKSIKLYEGQGSILPASNPATNKYTLKIEELNYDLEIEYSNAGERHILSIKESYPSAFDDKIRTSEAVLKKREWSDYWTKNNASDTILRKQWLIDYQ